MGLLCSYTTVIFLFGEHSARNNIAMHAVAVRRFLVHEMLCLLLHLSRNQNNGTTCELPGFHYTLIHCSNIKKNISDKHFSRNCNQHKSDTKYCRVKML